MPKPINRTFGQCKCRVSGCDELADVRRLKSHERGAQYLVCPEHGPDRAQGAKAQSLLDEWIEKNSAGQESTEHDTETGPEVSETKPEQEAEPEKPATATDGPEPKPEQEPEQDQSGPGFIKQAAQQFDDWFKE